MRIHPSTSLSVANMREAFFPACLTRRLSLLISDWLASCQAQYLKHNSEGGYIELDDGQKRAISRMTFYRNMYFLAHRKVLNFSQTHSIKPFLKKMDLCVCVCVCVCVQCQS